jgi:hypothetical protein
MPTFKAAPQIPLDLSTFAPHLAFDPIESEMLMRLDSTDLHHPLADSSEVDYRFEAGDTTVIQLPDGRSVRLLELRFIPRRRHAELINGSFWLDADTHAVVRANFKLARAVEPDEDDDTPAFLQPVRADLDFVAIEYGLWELRWWLPRLVAARGYFQVNRIRVPLSYERTYEGYTVRGDTSGAVLANDSTPRPCRPDFGMAIHVQYGEPPTDSLRQAWADSTRTRRERRRAERVAAGDTTVAEPCDRAFNVTTAPDSVLLNSPELPPSIYADDLELMTEAELEEIVGRVRDIAPPPWQLGVPTLDWGLAGPARYNRVEGLSVGARLNFDLNVANLETEARIGVADWEPRGEVALDRVGDMVHSRLAAYRRLQSTGPSTGVSGAFASLGALLFGRDDADYFDALGAELTFQPPDFQPQWYDLRLYAERQRTVERNTDFSLPHLIDSDHVFRENFAADRADQIGARLRLRTSFGQNPASPRVAGELSLGGEVGAFDFVRPEAIVRASTGLPFGLALGVEGAAGTVEGDVVPSQALWRLGGAPTLRGYAGSALVGERFWRARAELGLGVEAARVTAFSDAGWAGPRNRFDTRDALISAGVGVSLMDGIVRFDLARGLRAPRDWRLHFYFNGTL